MGYTTDFYGSFVSKNEIPLELFTFVNAFCNTRRVKRNTNPKYGKEGKFFVLAEGFKGQNTDETVTNFNSSPDDQPGLWCDWSLTKNNHIEWNGSEKFYYYAEWLKYLLEYFFIPYNILFEGSVRWAGESSGDTGHLNLFIDDNGIQRFDVSGNPVELDYNKPKLDYNDLLSM